MGDTSAVGVAEQLQSLASACVTNASWNYLYLHQGFLGNSQSQPDIHVLLFLTLSLKPILVYFMSILIQTLFFCPATFYRRQPDITVKPVRLSNFARLSLLCFVFVSLCYFEAMAPNRAQAIEEGETVVHRENSLYQYLLVVDNTEKNERYLVNLEKTSSYQGGVKLDAPDQLLFEYTRLSFLGLSFLSQMPKDALFVGMGIGAMPRFMARHFPETTINVAEIDPAVITIARKYFSFNDAEQMTVKAEDGRQFIKKSRKGYDIIFLDAYQGETIPFHLTTQEFLQEVKAKLNKGGVVVSNILASNRNKFFTAMVRTYSEEFPNLTIFKGKASNNYVFVATDRAVTPEAMTNRAREIQESRQLGIDLAEISQDQLIVLPPDEKAKVLTDDFAPVHIYQHMEEGQP